MTKMNQQRAEEPVGVDPFLIRLNRVRHSRNAIEIRIIRKKTEIRNHKKKLRNIERRLESLYRQKRTAEGELMLAEMDLNVLQEGLRHGSDSD